MKVIGEEYHQMDLDDLFGGDEKSNLFAVSKVLASCRKQMTLDEYKVLALALTKIRWKETCPEALRISKKEISKVLDINADSSDLSQILRMKIGDMAKHTYIKFSGKDRNSEWQWINGNFLDYVQFYKGQIELGFCRKFLPLFGGLTTGYMTMLATDIFSMSNERSVLLYELLRSNTDTRRTVNEIMLTTKGFKDLFEIPKEAYTTKDGHFARLHFERRVIDPACADLAKTKMITLAIQQNGMYYEKVKKGGRVYGYIIRWLFSSYPSVATASEKAEIQEAVDKDGRILKVAKDIVKGKKTSKKTNKKESTFDQFEQNEYNFEELEKAILDK